MSIAPVAALAGEPGKLQREVWKDIKWNGTWHLKNHEKFLGQPEVTELIDGVEPPSNWGDNYGQRLRGYLTVPESGEYSLFIAGDDNCELWLGEGESKFKTEKVAWIVGLGWGHGRDYSLPREWRKIPTQQSKALKLETGKKYFIEIIHKEGVGADHVSIGWLKPGAKDIEVIPKSAIESYSKSNDAEDVDGDELADSWEEANGLSPRDNGKNGSVSGAAGDPDLDRLKNWEEQRHQTNPKSDRGRAGHLQRDIWYGVWGRSVSNLMGHAGYYRKADRRDLVEGATTDTDYGDQCGVRLRGFLLPPDDGEYEFWVAGDDHCELWLSDGESKFNVKRLAAIDSGPGFVKPGEWDKLESQHSKPVRLQAGKRYYIEVLLKEGWWQDFVSVAWARPGQERQVIPAEFLESYVPSEEDRDDDGLPGEWEQSFGLDLLDSEGDHGALGDPDGDMIPNFMEYLDSTSPVVANPLWGASTLQVWYGLGGVRVSDLVDSKAFRGIPNSTSLNLGGLDFGGRGDRYGMRVRYRIKPPKSGEFRFWIAGDDNCELWLSQDETKFLKRKIAWVKGPGSGNTGDWVEPKKWDWQASQRSAAVHLEADKEYFMEVLLKEGSGGDHLAVAWQGAGVDQRVVVPDTAIASYLLEAADADDDYLPDEWERVTGLNAKDNGFEDGQREGEYGDHDGDRLDNRTEFLLGTNPCSADSDSDGVGDYDEVKVYGSNPTEKDASPPVVVATLSPGGAITSNQNWRPYGDDGVVYSLERRGQSTWEFEVDKAGVYRIDLSGRSVGADQPVASIPVSVKVDGIRVGEGQLEGSSTKLSLMTPWLPAGRHEVTLLNHNVRSGLSMVVESLEILAQTGADSDGNGLPDWLEQYYRTLNCTRLPEAGFVTSPANIEGSSRFFEDVEIKSGSEVVETSRGIQGSWFADLALDDSGKPTVVDVSYEGGALFERIELVWKEINLLDGVEVRYVRPGDAVRLTAFDAASGTDGVKMGLSTNGELLYSGTAAEPYIHRFEDEGSFEIKAVATGLSGDSLSTTVTFHVVGAELGADFHVPSNLGRKWTPADLPVGVIVETDDNLALAELFSKGNRSFEASFSVSRGTSGRVIARLPDGGAILDAATIHGFFLAASTWTGEHELVEVLPDGTRVIRVGYVIDGEIPPDLSLWIQMYVPDAVFANGDSWLRLTADDFDENGRAEFEIYKAPGDGIPYVCHWIRPFGEGPDSEQKEKSLSAAPVGTQSTVAE